MTQITLDTSKGQLVAYVFGQDALAASQSNVQLPTAISEGSQVNAGYTMPFKGEIVAVAAQMSAAGSAGSLTVGATVGGTEDADTTMTITTEVNKSLRVPRGKAPFAAGAELGCEITTDASWNGTSADLVAVVYVLHYLEGV